MLEYRRIDVVGEISADANGMVTAGGSDVGSSPRVFELQSLVMQSSEMCQAATDRAKSAEENVQQVGRCRSWSFFRV